MKRFQVEERTMRPLDVAESELLTLSAAARRMGLTHVNTVANLVERGTLRRVLDMGEKNRMKRTRVFASDVEAEIARRRVRRGEGDSRIRGRVK